MTTLDAPDAQDTSFVLSAATVVAGGVVRRPGWLEIAGGRVRRAGSSAAPGRVDHDLGDALVLPGFVDIHVHGGGGASFDSSDPDDLVRAVASHRAAGTTTMLASLVTAAPAALRRSVALLAALVADGLVGGIHLEGPWLSVARRGAHDIAQLRDPDPREIDALLEVGAGAIRMVTVAPERPGALAAIRRLVGAGVVVAVGHTDADHDTTSRAIDAGATVATHLFNAMRPLHHRAPGPIGALLDDPRVIVELVLDGLHLHPAVYRHVVAAAPDRVCLVTDATAAAGMPDGTYELGGRPIVVADGVARLVGTDTIAGGTATADKLFRNAADWGRPEGDAGLLAAVRQTSDTPARAIGLGPRTLAVGEPADLVVLDTLLTPVASMRRGRFDPPWPGR